MCWLRHAWHRVSSMLAYYMVILLGEIMRQKASYRAHLYERWESINRAASGPLANAASSCPILLISLVVSVCGGHPAATLRTTHMSSCECQLVRSAGAISCAAVMN